MRQRRRRVFAIALASALLAAGACSAGSSVTPTQPSSASSTATTGPSSTGPQTSGSTSSVSSSATSAATDKSIAIGFILEPTSLDFTQDAGAAVPQVMLDNIYQTLVGLDQNERIVPALASSWTVSPDGKTYTFTLHAGVKFSDGAPFTADDAKFSIDRLAGWKNPISKESTAFVASTTVVSPLVLKVTLKAPSNSWLFNMTGRVGAMFSRTGVSDLANKPIGTGPYLFQTWNHGSSIVLTRNPTYWGPAPAIKTVTFKYFTDPTAMNNALLTGGIQVVSTVQTPAALGQFKNNSKYRIIDGTTDGEVMMTLNNSAAPLTDVRVRQAINYAIDKKAILQGAWSGYGTVIGSHESPNDPWFVDESNRYPHDVAKAKQLLAAAGQSHLTLSLQVPPVPYAAAAAPIIVSELAEAGITVNASNVTFPVWLTKVFGQADYQMTIINHVEPHDIATIWGDPTYYTRYNNPKVQALLKAGDAGSQAVYIADYKQVVKILADDAAAAWLWSFPNLLVADAGIGGLPTNAVGESFDVSTLTSQ